MVKIVGAEPTYVSPENYRAKVSEYFAGTAKYQRDRGCDVSWDDTQFRLKTMDEKIVPHLMRWASQLAYSLKRRHGIRISYRLDDSASPLLAGAVVVEVED